MGSRPVYSSLTRMSLSLMRMSLSLMMIVMPSLPPLECDSC